MTMPQITKEELQLTRIVLRQVLDTGERLMAQLNQIGSMLRGILGRVEALEAQAVEEEKAISSGEGEKDHKG